MLDFDLSRVISRVISLLYSRYRRNFIYGLTNTTKVGATAQLATGISRVWNLTSAKVCVNRSRVVRPRPSLSIVSYSYGYLRLAQHMCDIYNVASSLSLFLFPFIRGREKGIFPARRTRVERNRCDNLPKEPRIPSLTMKFYLSGDP